MTSSKAAPQPEALSGVTIAAKYVSPAGAVPGASLRMQGDLEPVVIVAGGKPVGWSWR
jgi:hypothetical protein